jgi:predicted AAA+ superfamily ATPase
VVPASHFIEDTEGYNMELRYLRDTDKREVDFVVLREKKPLFAVECKASEKSLNPAINYFNERTDIPLYFQVHTQEKDFIKGNIRLLPFGTFCRELHMV